MNLEDARFVTRNVTPEEKAAVLAVLDAHLDEESAIEHAVQNDGRSEWQKSQKGLRSPLPGA